MKNLFLNALTIITACCVNAQTGVGISTSTPHSNLTVAGSISTNYRSFTGSTNATSTDNLLVFNGSTAESISLPTAVGCAGRNYMIKNAGTNPPVSVLTIVPNASENIEGLSSWILDETNLSVTLVSNGANWHIILQNPKPVSGIHWNQNGNNVLAETTIGTISDHAFSFITNNVERMRLTSTGNLAVGTIVFDAVNPERLLVDQGMINSINVISGKGNYDNYLQLNIQNRLAGNLASSDVVASNNTATETSNFIDMGINSSVFSNPLFPILDGANNSYLYSTGNDLIMGNGIANKNLSFFTGGFATSNEWLRINGAGLVGVNTITQTERVQVEGNLRLSGLNRAIFFESSVDPYAGIKNISRAGEVNELMLFSGNDVTSAFGADRIRLATHEIHFATSPANGTITSGDPGSFYESTTNAPTRLFINENGKVAINNTIFNLTQPEQLLVDAGATTSYNVISGKGNLNGYLQLNIQNNSNGAAASSDIVATADNGNELINFVNLGINSDGYTGTGITGGANNAYLFTTGNDFIIGNSTDNRNLIFFTSTGGVGIQRMRITNAGLIAGQDNVYSLGNTGNRHSEVWAVNGAIQTSDGRLKKNILPLSYGLEEIMQLNPIAYNWIDGSKANKIGLIAQDVKKIIPEVIAGNEESESLGMNYAEMIPVLINGIKELHKKLDVLKVKAKQLQ